VFAAFGRSSRRKEEQKVCQLRQAACYPTVSPKTALSADQQAVMASAPYDTPQIVAPLCSPLHEVFGAIAVYTAETIKISRNAKCRSTTLIVMDSLMLDLSDRTTKTSFSSLTSARQCWCINQH